MFPTSHSHPDNAAMLAIEGAAGNVAERMADIMVQFASQGCEASHLLEHGFTPGDIVLHGDEATAIARQRFLRLTERPAYNRRARLNRAAATIAALMPSQTAIRARLTGERFTAEELKDFLPEAITLAADNFAHRAGGNI